MPLLDPLTGDEFELHVSEDGTAFVPIDGLNAFRKGSERASTATSFFGRDEQFTTFAKRNVSISFGGAPVPDDPGQIILRETEAGPPGTTCFLRAIYASGMHYTMECRIGTQNHNVDNPDGLQGADWTAASVGNTVAGTGARVL